MAAYPTMTEEVSAVFERYPDSIRQQLLALRAMIFDTAAATDGVGQLEETLKWGQISYLTPHTKSGTTIRIDAVADDDERVALFCHCQTTLIDTFRSRYGELFEFEGNRSVRFRVDDHLPADAVQHCITLALTYHQSKRSHQGS